MVDGVLFLVLIALTGSMLFVGIARRGGYLHVPTLFAAVYAGWVIPQLWSLDGQYLTWGDSLRILLIMAMLCLVATWLGWQTAMNSRRDRLEPFLPRLDDRATTWAAVLLTTFAAAAFGLMGFTPIDEQQTSMWTGNITIFYFFLNLKSAALALSVMLFLRKRSVLSTALLLINVGLYFPYMVLLFKRRHIAEFLLIGAFSVLMMRNWAIPRAAVIASLVIASITTFAATELRYITADGGLPSIAEIRDIDFLALNPINDPTASPEITNAANLVHAVSTTGRYTFGGQTWNRIVFQYVPGQIVGFDFKRSLMATPWPEEIMLETTGYRTPTGTTQTGIATSYMEFGYLGCVFFFATAYVLGLMWRRALVGNVWDKSWYAAAMVPSFLAITSHASYFFIAFFLFFVVMGGLGVVLRSISRWQSGPEPLHHRYSIGPRA